MLVFERKFVITEQEDGSYTVSVKVKDDFLMVTTATEAELRQLKQELEEVLPED